MQIRIIKYLLPATFYAVSLLAFLSHGLLVWLPVLYAWMIIPLLELFLKPDETNLTVVEEELAKRNKAYDYLLYAIVPLQYAALIVFLFNVSTITQSTVDLIGKTTAMGLLCGSFGINVGHELGHRINEAERLLAQSLLLTSLYMHFIIEHNKGHHKRVATPEDPASARYGQTVYAFWIRSVVYSYLSAWHIAAAETEKKGYKVFSLHNEMVRFQLIQVLFVALLFFLFGWLATVLFVAAAVQGILLLETVNYIEHYGLQRKKIGEGKWERAMPAHSWNSNHVIGRLMLFELSRHSDHHYLASRKYQILKHHDDAPQMPTGYPGMMILSLFPPLWFTVMNKRIDRETGIALSAPLQKEITPLS